MCVYICMLISKCVHICKRIHIYVHSRYTYKYEYKHDRIQYISMMKIEICHWPNYKFSFKPLIYVSYNYNHDYKSKKLIIKMANNHDEDKDDDFKAILNIRVKSKLKSLF